MTAEPQPAYLALEGGRLIEARSRAPGDTEGELVFTTAYTGYEESLTDPSYEQQVLTFSYPLIGNYGVRADRFESDRVHPRAVVARELTDEIVSWLTEEGVPAIDHLDTRDLVTGIRDEGAMQCGISAGPNASADRARERLEGCIAMSDHRQIGEQVSTPDRVTHNADGEGPRVALIDCGAKGSIISSLVERDAVVEVLPHDTTRAEVDALDPALLFVSNGPGDPANFTDAEALVASTAGEIPLAGICLGQQVVANALDGGTEKMPFGHRGVNQPVRDLRSGRVVMTTQNHGYTVTDPGPLDVTQINVNDDTPEGLESEELGVITRQYHPEATPGPNDSLEFFDEVLTLAERPRTD
jgi:carbamoyl-phosphate synthase small subunit